MKITAIALVILITMGLGLMVLGSVQQASDNAAVHEQCKPTGMYVGSSLYSDKDHKIGTYIEVYDCRGTEINKRLHHN